jgi:uncharacterized protein (TIGR02145 family)
MAAGVTSVNAGPIKDGIEWLDDKSAILQSMIVRGYKDNKDGTITDTKTKLQWKRCSEGQSWNGRTCTGEAETFRWAEAMKLRSEFAGYSDWRLPTIAELNTLVYCSNGKQRKFDENGYSEVKHEGRHGCGSDTRGDYQSPTIDTQAFPNTPESFFWSASPDAANSALARGVHFYNGNDYWVVKDGSVPVRLVRGQ